MKKPSNLTYAVDDVPPLGITVLNGLQQVGVLAISLILPLLVFREAGLDSDGLRDAMSMSMLVLAIGTILPALRAGPVGSGFLCPSNFSAFYFSASLLAVRVGGLPLVFGMTVFAGVVEAALARLQHALRPFLPPELSGLIVLLLSVNLGGIGLRYVLGVGAPQPAGAAELAVAAFTLGMMIGLNVWGGRMLGMFSALLGMFAGYVMAATTGLIAAEQHDVGPTPVFALPLPHHIAWTFDGTLAVAFGVAALGACLKSMGTVTTCQKINDADWVRPDIRSAGRGVLADALCTICSGLLGTFGVNSSAAAVGVAGGSGVTSRRVAFAAAGILAILAFLPKVASTLAFMPRPVMGAAILFASCFIFVNGLSIISSRLLDARRTFVIGISFMTGMAVDLFPQYFGALPARLQPLLGSSLVVGALSALLLNAAFRLGTKQVATHTVDPQRHDPVEIEQFMEKQGAAWGARRDVIERAKFNLTQSVETIIDGCSPRGPLEINATFDEFSLDVRVSYPGAPLALPDKRPTSAEIMASDEGQQALAGFLLRRLADRVRATHSAGRSTVFFHFDH